jgi:hypothetical protein
MAKQSNTEAPAAGASPGTAAATAEPTPAGGAAQAAPQGQAPQAAGAATNTPGAVVRPWEAGKSVPPPPPTEAGASASPAAEGEAGEVMEALVHVHLGATDLDGNGPEFAPGAPMRVTEADAKALAAARAAKPVRPRK